MFEVDGLSFSSVRHLKVYSRGLVRHSTLCVPEMCTGVRGQTASATSMPNALRPVLPGVALFAEQYTLMIGHVGTVQVLVAQIALEAAPMKLFSRGQHLLRGVHGLLAHGAFGALGGFERHVHWFELRTIEMGLKLG